MNNTEILEKKLNNITKILWLVIAIVVVNLGLTIISLGDIKSNTSKEEDLPEYDVSEFTEVTVEEYLNLFKKDELVVVYTGREGCGYCRMFLPVLKQAQKEYNYINYYLDIDKLDADSAKLLQDLDSDIAKNLGQTPYTIISKNGKLIDTFLGYDEFDAFAKFISTNGIKKR